ncbi:Cytosolic protein [Azospirillaceae bacterium]
MNVFYLVTGSGSMLVMTSYPSLSNPGLLKKLTHKGLTKFFAYTITIEQAREWYGDHFEVVAQDLRSVEDLRVIDYNGYRVFERLDFDKVGAPQVIEIR